MLRGDVFDDSAPAAIVVHTPRVCGDSKPSHRGVVVAEAHALLEVFAPNGRDRERRDERLTIAGVESFDEGERSVHERFGGEPEDRDGTRTHIVE